MTLNQPGATRGIALRFAAGMVGTLAGLSVIVAVLAVVLWWRGGEDADAGRGMAIGFGIGALVLAGIMVWLRRYTERVERDLFPEDSAGK